MKNSKPKNNLNPYLQAEVESVFKMVEEITGITKTNIVSSNRKRHFVDARKILVNVLRKILKLTCCEAGTIIQKDHSAVVHYGKMHIIHMKEPEYRRMFSAVSGAYLIRKSSRDEERLQEQFRNLQQKTRILLNSLEGQEEFLEHRMNTLKDQVQNETL